MSARLVTLAWCASLTHTLSAQEFRALGDIVTGYPYESVPRWSGGALIAISGNASVSPVVLVFDAGGRQTASIPVTIPQANRVLVRRAARGIDGSVAICGSATDPEGHVASFLMVASADAKIHSIIRLEPYNASAVTVAPDGTLWMKGTQVDGIKRALSQTQRGIIRHFDISGKLLAEFLPQSTLKTKNLLLGIDELASSTTRVGWYLGRNAAGYFEVEGGRLERYPPIDAEGTDTGVTVSGLTITEDGAVFVTRSVHGNNPQLYTLDRKAGKWTIVAVPAGGEPAATSWLLGGSGNTLVLKTTEQASRLRRFEVRPR